MMEIEQRRYRPQSGWKNVYDTAIDRALANVVWGFGSSDVLKDSNLFFDLRSEYPRAEILICTTAGEIMDVEVDDGSLSVTAVQFNKTQVESACVSIYDYENSFLAGYELASRLNTENLKSVLVIADGQLVNGSELVLAMNQFLPAGVLITGGMAGDGARFQETCVGLNEVARPGQIAAIGFYGEHLEIASGSIGGWDTFGIERLITRSDENILYELDGKPALDVYKLYLGDYAAELPGSGLLFPLCIRVPGSNAAVVRTILGVDEKHKSLKFAGSMPQGAYAQLMKANLDRLIDGAEAAAQACILGRQNKPQLAILISCVGRKLVLGQRIEEEVEIIRSVFGTNTMLAGFYSYGEFAPPATSRPCELHNQTMTITTFSEHE